MSHKAEYEELLAQQDINTCGFSLQSEKAMQLARQFEKPEKPGKEPKKAAPGKAEPVALKEEQTAKMLEKGLRQSEQIKENPLARGVAVGKRGRPRTSDRVSSGKPPSKRRKTEVDPGEGKDTKEPTREERLHALAALGSAGNVTSMLDQI